MPGLKLIGQLKLIILPTHSKKTDVPANEGNLPEISEIIKSALRWHERHPVS